MHHWTTFDLVFFDCDSTLSAIEGVDELARLKGKEWRVGLLTRKAMDGDLDLTEVYGKRLQAINPTRGHLEDIEQRYWESKVSDAQAVIEALQWLQKHVFIISGGLADAVNGFGRRLGVAPDHIRAVSLQYNELSGDWWRYYDRAAQRGQRYLDHDNGPLTASAGKSQIIRELAGRLFGRHMLVGDGVSDLATRANGIDLFVGFGGAIVRETVEREAHVFIYPATLSPALPLAVGLPGLQAFKDSPYESIFQKGLELCRTSAVGFREAGTRKAFLQEFEQD
ncbi:MAG: HAD-IB family phosphatase [Shimia sp.]|nr:HAD-IB family phosphatase [Shimia sp.]